MNDQDFIPGTREIEIQGGVVYRPIRSWHSNTFAGERLTKLPGSQDRSGCMFENRIRGLRVCSIPLTVTHRLYWLKSNPSLMVSAFLSYPDAMGFFGGDYFWETNADPTDIARFSNESDMEKHIVRFLQGKKQAK